MPEIEEAGRITTRETFAAIILAICILIVSQFIAAIIGNAVVGAGDAVIGMGAAVGNAVAAALYLVFALSGLKLLCEKFLKMPVAEFGITRYKLKPVWILSAVVMPVLVIITLVLTPGHWNNPAMDKAETAAALTGAILFTGISVGIVEEAVFRGIIMKTLELRYNKPVAVIAPSVLFGALHIIGVQMDFISIVQLIIAGSIVGILFSLVTYESGNIWSNALMHSIWNMCMASGILTISQKASEKSIFHYVLETDSFLLTGGDFGVEASIVSIMSYLIFTVLAAVLIKKKK